MKTKHLKTDRVFQTLNYIILGILMIMCIFPFYYVLIYSLSSSSETVASGPVFLPKGFTFNNYIEILRLPNIFQSFLISLLRTVTGTVLTVFCSSLFAYIVSKKELFLRSAIYRITVITIYFSSGLIPWYLTMVAFGLKNNFLLYILPFAVTPYYVILIKTYMEQLPASLEESAMIDGAGYFTIYRRIIFPLSVPILATIAVFASVGQWNAWTDNFFLVNSKELRTMQLVLYDYLNEAARIADAMKYSKTNVAGSYIISTKTIQVTITMVVVIPVLIVYPFMQRYFVKGIMLGAIKG